MSVAGFDHLRGMAELTRIQKTNGGYGPLNLMDE